MPQRRATTKGFTRTSSLLAKRIRVASESRGFAQSRLLTQWAEIAGADIATIARPVEISYGRGGFGATLTLLTTGPHAPMLEMQKEKLRERVNGVYGYNAVARVRITQTAPTGFAEGQVAFTPAPSRQEASRFDPKLKAAADAAAAPIQDDGLRRALAQLGENILKKTN
ncbi:MAG: DciA family protein [Pseudomonadota bacterium]